MRITTVDRDRDDVANTTNGARTAGFTYDGAAYCPACAEDVTVTINGETMTMPEAAEVRGTDENGFGVGLVQTSSEWDAPGASCTVCHDRLATRLIHYDDNVVADGDVVGGGA